MFVVVVESTGATEEVGCFEPVSTHRALHTAIQYGSSLKEALCRSCPVQSDASGAHDQREGVCPCSARQGTRGLDREA